MSKHVLGITSGETAGLDLEVQEDGIRLPLAQCPDGGLVNARDEQGGGSTREAIGFNLIGRNVGDVLDSGDSGSQFMGNLGGGDVARLGVAVIVGVEGSLWRGSMVVKMEDHCWPAWMGQRTGSPDSPCPRASPWVAFFWSV